MPVTAENLMSMLKQMREASTKRKFNQSVDLSMIFVGMDPKKPEGRITEDVLFPHPVSETRKVMVFADGELARRAREAGADSVMSREEMEALGKDRKQAKKLAREYDAFLAQADYMVMIGKVLGPVLGPRGKMPKPVPPTANPVPMIERMKRTVRVATKDQAALHVKIGVEGMSDEHLAENARAVIEAIEHKLEGKGKIGSIQIKATMGKPVRLEVEK